MQEKGENGNIKWENSTDRYVYMVLKYKKQVLESGRNSAM